MSLEVIATPIGHPDDITLRALSALKAAEVVIGEEFKEVSKLLKRYHIEKKTLRTLNEHSTSQDIQELVALCHDHRVCLVSDCGTPGFCDPGFQLIALCRQKNISVTSLPGASSLMTLISLASQKLESFYFAGFLPADQEMRRKELKSLEQISSNLILMDTPYRLQKLLGELNGLWPDRKALLVLNATQTDETIIEGRIRDLLPRCPLKKAEFIVLIYSKSKKTHQ